MATVDLAAILDSLLIVQLIKMKFKLTRNGGLGGQSHIYLNMDGMSMLHVAYFPTVKKDGEM